MGIQEVDYFRADASAGVVVYCVPDLECVEITVIDRVSITSTPWFCKATFMFSACW